MNDDLPEWMRVVAIFTLTFALCLVLAGLVGFKVDWVEDPDAPPWVYNMP